ncbi:unnamed protein product [Mytilus coruscus]|uniref:Farnesoic acid O-methyl transferase domain-containing protein n=1 Tax=Mytilus coruscus TaxID=42192 RepID=A0A6J8DPI8_MYTCO|nr:unnamed protein product [Mytilus coruscus]
MFCTDLNTVEASEGRLDFLAYMVDEDHNNDSIPDYWTLRFWFQGNADGMTKKKTFTDYFQELLNPTNFPKKSFTTVFTPAVYTYQLLQEIPILNKTFITFMLKAAGDAHIALSAVYSKLECKILGITIGAENNTKSTIKEDPEEEFGKQARKKKLKKALIWLAKKQRLLQCLDDSYPNTLPISNLFKLCKVKLSDTTTAALMLNDLQNKGFIKEEEKCLFRVRIQSGGGDANDEVQIVKNIPRLTSQEQPTIAVITSLYCEKLAVDALSSRKQKKILKVVQMMICNYVLSLSESQVYSVGRIGRHKIVSTKLSKDASSPDKSEISTENSVTRLLDDTLQKVVEKIRKVTDSLSDTEEPWDIYLKETSERLKAEESSFHRPFINTDRLYYTNPDGTVVEVQHPSGDRNYIEGRTNVRFGAISNEMNIAKDGKLRKTFARLYGIKAYDLDTDAILESLEGNRNESFLIIRRIADYADGSRKEWQPYSAMAAAAYMKTLIMAL